MPGLYGLSSNANISVYNTTGLYNVGNANVVIKGNVGVSNTTGLYQALGNPAVLTSAQVLLSLLSQSGNVNFALTNGNTQVLAYDLLSGSSFYSNANVSAYLPTYTGSLSNSSDIINLYDLSQTLSANLGAFETYANATFSTGGGSSYGNANVAGYLPNYGGEINATNIFNDNFTQLQYSPTLPANAYDLGQGSWLYLDVNGLTVQSNVTGLNSTMSFANDGNLSVSNSVITTNGVFWPNGEPYSSGGSTYSNANVQSYMQHFDADIIPSANSTYSLGSVNNWWKDLYLSNNTLYLGGVPLAIIDGNLAVNSVQIPGTYSNANVAAYLPSDPTITNIEANVGAFETYANATFATQTTVQTLDANVGAFETYANATFATQTTVQTLDANIGAFETYANAEVQTINANLGAFQTYANIHFGDSNYGNANVAAYLPVYGGNILVNYEQANSVVLSTTSGITGWQPGQLAWDPLDETVSVGMLNGVTLQLGQEQYIRVKASAAITNGQGVMFTGALGDNITAAPNDVTSAGYSSSYFIGVATQDIALNDFGYITTFGKVHGINTNSYSVGNILYASTSTPGALTATEPAAPGPKIQVAAVVKKSAGDGHIFVRPTVYPTLAQLSDVQDAAANYDYLRFNSTGNIWQPKSLSSDPLIQSIQANIGGSETYANVTFATKTAVQTLDANVGAYEIATNANLGTVVTNLQTLDANVGAYETWANATFSISSYSNTNVAAYLPTYSGNISANNVLVTSQVRTPYLQITTANVRLGLQAAASSSSGVAIGETAGSTTQGSFAVAVGQNAGKGTGTAAIAIGPQAGSTSQGNYSIAIGQYGGARINANAVAIGTNVGRSATIGTNSIVIGTDAGNAGTAANVIMLNATGQQLAGNTTNAFYVNPIRNDESNVSQAVYYNTTTKEVTYGAASATYGNTQVAAYLPLDPTIYGIQANLGAFEIYANATFGTSSFGNSNVIALLGNLNPSTTIQQYSGSLTVGRSDTQASLTLQANAGLAGGGVQNITMGFANPTGNISIISGNTISWLNPFSVIGGNAYVSAGNYGSTRADTGHLLVSETIVAGGNISTLNSINAGSLVTTNGVFWANGTSYSTGGGSGTYGNADVSANLRTYTGTLNLGSSLNTTTLYLNSNSGTTNQQLAMGPIIPTSNLNILGSSVGYGFGNVVVWKSGFTVQNGNALVTWAPYGSTANTGHLIVSNTIVAGGNISAPYFIGDGSQLTNTYGNTQVAAYLPTDPTITGIQANLGAYQTWANATIQTTNANLGAYQIATNANIGTVTVNLQTLNANVGAFETYANATFGTSGYGNTQVNAYLNTTAATPNTFNPFLLAGM